MTIEQILSNSNKKSSLTNKLVFNSLKTEIENCFYEVPNRFCSEVSDVISKISEGDARKLGYCDYSSDCSPIPLSDETKEEVLEAYKKSVRDSILSYEKRVKAIFNVEDDSEENEEEPVIHKQFEITFEKPFPFEKHVSLPSIFGY